MVKEDAPPGALFNSHSKALRWVGALLLISLLAVSYAIRKKDFNTVTGVQNLEATYHALLTIKALHDSPIENHWLLPTVTLGKIGDKNISWGATVPTKTGDYIYTSFTAPGFLAPYLVFAVMKIEASVKNIARFNFMIGALVSLVLYALLLQVLAHYGYSPKTTVVGSVLGTTVAIFSKEVLQSHGAVYWSQSLYQLLLISSLYLLFGYLTSNPSPNGGRKKYAVSLLAMVFLGAWTEWTGYFFGLGIAALFWRGVLINQPQKALAIKLSMAVAGAALLTLLHIGCAVGFGAASKAFMSRFLARSATAGSMTGLLSGYALSFGLFIVVLFAALAAQFFVTNRQQKESPVTQNQVVFLLLAATIPLLENFLVLQHAETYSFDRLKFIFPAAIVISIAFARQTKHGRIGLAFLVMVASIQGYLSYRSHLSFYGAWQEIDAKNRALALGISKSTNIECTVLLSQGAVRGYSNLIFNRGIHENQPKDNNIELMHQTGACTSVYLEELRSENTSVHRGLPSYRSALVTNRDGTSFSLSLLELGNVSAEFFLTDSTWQNGVARHWPGFFVPNSGLIQKQVVDGEDVIFRNGDRRKITRVEEAESFIHVNVDGPILNAADVGPPTLYIIRRTLSDGT